MKEQIILAPGLGASELMRSLAYHKKGRIGTRIMGAAELAQTALLVSGILVREELLSASEECTYVARAVKGEDYFGEPSYSDIREITGAIRRMRGLTTAQNEQEGILSALGQGPFEAKNKALFAVYQNYKKKTEEAGTLDGIDLVRKALFEAKEKSMEILVLEEYPLSPLEEAMATHLAKDGIHRIRLADLYGIGEDPSEADRLRIEAYRNCYGAPNEVETILTEIYRKYKLDEVTVAVTDPSVYGQLFFDYACLYDIPVTFGCGIPVTNAEPARLLVNYYHWITDGFFGADALLEMLESSSFDKSKLWAQLPERTKEFDRQRFYEILGGLRLTNDLERNHRRMEEYAAVMPAGDRIYLPYVKQMAEELALLPEEFISRYAYIRKGNETHRERLMMLLDRVAVSEIHEELSIIRRSGVAKDTDDIIRNVLGMSVCVQGSREGALHVTTVQKAAATMRPNLYLVGMSASGFPGAPRENYLLLDKDLEYFGEKAALYTSEGKVRHALEQMDVLIALASALGVRIFLSYAGLNVSELKQENASSVWFELFRREAGRNVTAKELAERVEKIEYFEPAISRSYELGRAYNRGEVILTDREDDPGIDMDREAVSGSDAERTNADDVVAVETEKALAEATAETEENSEITELMTKGCIAEREYSPSAILKYFDCPRRFYLTYILGIPEPDEEDPFEAVSAAAIGTMAHKLMERLPDQSLPQEDFLKLAGKEFDDHLVQNPPLLLESSVAIREEFLEMMENAYRTDPGRKTILKEEDIHCIHESGIRLHGYPDRVEDLGNGTCRIVDYKTGRTLKHTAGDVRSCLQILIYAYLMEQRGMTVDGGEYRYIRLGETVGCAYDAETKEQLSGYLNQFKDSLKHASFPMAQVGEDGKDPCRYCGYRELCMTKTEGGDL